MTTPAVTVARGLLCLACQLPLPLCGAEVGEVRALLRQAAAQHAEALRLEHGWTSTAPLMQAAREALERGELQRAAELAGRALLMAEQALAQARREREAWRHRAPGG